MCPLLRSCQGSGADRDYDNPEGRTVTQTRLWHCRGENIAQPRTREGTGAGWEKEGECLSQREQHVESRREGRSQLDSDRAARSVRSKQSTAQHSTGQHSSRKQGREGRLLRALNAKPRILGYMLRVVRRH